MVEPSDTKGREMKDVTREDVEALLGAIDALVEVGKLLDERTMQLAERVATLERHNRNGYYTYKPTKEDND
jgi:hypothetical protein